MAVEGKTVYTLRDYGVDFEQSSVSIPVAVMVAANIVAQDTLKDDLRTQIGLITLGGFTRDVRQNYEVLTPSVGLIVPQAQRENKWLVRYHDFVTGRKARVEIPTADLNLLDPNGDKADMTDVNIVAFVAAFEAVALGPDGNVAVVDDIIFVARNI